jgi:hypothetical protein
MLEALNRSRWTTPVVLLCFSALYLPSVGFGYRGWGDDFRLLTTDWGQFFRDPFAFSGRPVLSASCILLGEISASSEFQRIANLLLFLALVVSATAILRRRRFPPVALLFLIAALCHPSFLWAVTWIAHRSDLLLLLFSCLAILWLESPWSGLFLFLAAGSKSPFLFQNLAFSWVYLRERRYALAALAAALIPIFIYFGYVTYYATAVAVGEHGLFLLDPESESYLATIVLFRSIKILEGLFYTFFPVGAYALSALHLLLFSAILFACWGLILYDIARSGLRIRELLRNQNFALMASIGLLLSIPYAFSSGLRIYVPATLFLYLAVGAVAGRRPRVVASIGTIAAVHLLGILLNYSANRTDCFDLDPRFEMQCEGTEVPAEDWNRRRSQIVDRFVKDVLQ